MGLQEPRAMFGLFCVVWDGDVYVTFWKRHDGDGWRIL